MDLFGGPEFSLHHHHQQLQVASHLVPYGILALNCLLFKLLRSLVDRILRSILNNNSGKKQGRQQASNLALFFSELISTCELCAQCAELNVVYEQHGSLAYGLALFLLSYLWCQTFGEAHTTPGYLTEDYFLLQSAELEDGSFWLRRSTYARLIGQALAIPLAWRLAAAYWRHQLIEAHSPDLLSPERCQSSLATSAPVGFLVELGCCLLCRLVELQGHRWQKSGQLSERGLNSLVALVGSLLVVSALHLSGGYFNPMLAAALEFGCQGAALHQHALVFWLGPLLGHLGARLLFRRYLEDPSRKPRSEVEEEEASPLSGKARRTKSGRKRRRHAD